MLGLKSYVGFTNVIYGIYIYMCGSGRIVRLLAISASGTSPYTEYTDTFFLNILIRKKLK